MPSELPPPKPPRTVAEVYDDWHRSHPVDEASDTPWHRQLKPLLKGLAGTTTLEIACGRGGFAAWLGTLPDGERPARVVAADFSAVAVARAEAFGKSRNAEGVSYQVADLMNLPFSNDCFDVVISCETIEHTPNPRRAISELARVLKPGGTAYLTFPNWLNVSGLHRLYRRVLGKSTREEAQPIDHPLLRPRVTGWIRSAGLQVCAINGRGHYLPFPGRPPVSLDFLDAVPGAALFALHAVAVAQKNFKSR